MFGFGRRKRIEARLHEMQASLNTLLERSQHTMSQLDDLITAIDTETNLLAASVESDAKVIADLRAQLAAAPTVTQATLDTLTSVSTRLQAANDRLKAIGADPANPVPAPAPAPATPAA